MIIDTLDTQILTEHQLSPDGLSCTCGEIYYSVPAPYRETLWQQATHQLIKIGHWHD